MERRRGRSGKDSFDHPPRLSDDVANSVAGLSWLLLNDEDSPASAGFNARFHIANQPLLPAPYVPIFIGLTLTEPWASVIAQGQNCVQILAAFVSQSGGLRYHLESQVIPWLMQYARFAFSSRQNLLLGSYSDDMDLLTLQTLFASLETIAPWNWQQPSLQWEGRREAMLTVLSTVQRFTFTPQF